MPKKGRIPTLPSDSTTHYVFMYYIVGLFCKILHTLNFVFNGPHFITWIPGRVYDH